MGHIIDLLYRPERRILESLLCLVNQQMAKDKIDVLKCLAIGNSPLADALKRHGFRQKPEGVKMIAWVLAPSIARSDFFDASQWYITYADLDGA